MLQKIDKNLYRLLIPFERITTTVYIAVYEEGAAVIDAATTPSDAQDYILPALRKLGIADGVRWLLLTHTHGDHAGGLAKLSELLPRARVGFFAPVEGFASAVLRKKSFRKSFAKRALDTGAGLLYDGITPLHRRERTVSKPKGEL